jgi:hypothetical protein
VFNVNILFHTQEDSSNEDANSRADSLKPGEYDVDQIVFDFMKKIREGVHI